MDWVVVETNLSSAFQRAAREDMLRELWAEPSLRALIPLFRNLYGGCARLFFEEVAVLFSQEGSHLRGPKSSDWAI